MKIRCPRCGKKVDWEDSPFRPFCSERCKMIDFGGWLDGNYTIPGESPDGNQKDEKKNNF